MFITKVIRRFSRLFTTKPIDPNHTATDALGRLSQAITELETRIELLQQERNKDLRQISYLTSALHLQQGRFDARPPNTKSPSDDSTTAAQSAHAAQEEAHARDAWYAAFQDRFRGSREDIKMRLHAHLPRVRAAGVGTEAMPIVDLGCGRGEWLELLKDEGLKARGADLNRVSIARCREMGLEIAEEDALSYLRNIPDTAVGAVTGFHIIEHLPFDVLLALLDETHRVLKPGGLAIFETPNPQNVMVGSCTFYLDPTHRRPIPAGLMQFVMEMQGFTAVEVVPLHPYPERAQVHGSNLAERFNEYFHGPQDYAVLGRKP
ncbi:MAG: class I SAM-dependent methyltransferase [Planctomycetes bacterium]|nr:class I SAM-dependent methyltransferase [Planctomycetota bacterium]